jgi:predicted phosphodiesterase
MRIQFASDLHIEFRQNKDFLLKNPLQPKGEVLILAGDIALLDQKDIHRDFFKSLSDNFMYTYWVPGNHEYYDSETDASFKVENVKIKDNVFLVNNTSIIQGNIKFIFTTLWTNIREAYRWQVEHKVNDYRLIRYNGKKFRANSSNELHEKSFAFIKSELENRGDFRTLVATHHVPTLSNYPIEYIDSPINDAFAVDLSGFIDANGPDAWIYGHSHANVPNFKIGKTLMTTNQLGYVMYDEHSTFDNTKIIEL